MTLSSPSAGSQHSAGPARRAVAGSATTGRRSRDSRATAPVFTRFRTAGAALTATLVGTALAIVPASPAHAATWSTIPTPNGSSERNILRSVDALSTTDAWAVGDFVATTAPWDRPLAARWNGSTWTLTSPPTPSGGAILHGVDGSASNNVWAVGRNGTAAGLIQRWNGTSWSTVSSPSPAGATGAVLAGVKTFSTTNAWAVGSVGVSTGAPFTRTLVKRWNGTSWSIVSTPNPDPTQNVLVAVDGTSANDIWAVGGIGHDGYEGRTTAGLVLRWNGSSWTRAAIPDFDSTFSTIELTDVVALAANDVWVVGTAWHRQLFREVPYLLRWNGTTWKHSTIPNPPAGGFNSVTALSPTKVYAVGNAEGRTLVARWNGSSWTQETTPAPGLSSELLAAAATGTGTVWAVGVQMDSQLNLRTLAIRTANG
jgi:hypothetical protein